MVGSLFGAGDFGDDLYSLAYVVVAGSIEVAPDTYAAMGVHAGKSLSSDLSLGIHLEGGFTRIIFTAADISISFTFSSKPFIGQFWRPIGDEDSPWSPTAGGDEFWQPIVPNQGSWNG